MWYLCVNKLKKVTFRYRLMQSWFQINLYENWYCWQLCQYIYSSLVLPVSIFLSFCHYLLWSFLSLFLYLCFSVSALVFLPPLPFLPLFLSLSLLPPSILSHCLCPFRSTTLSLCFILSLYLCVSFCISLCLYLCLFYASVGVYFLFLSMLLYEGTLPLIGLVSIYWMKMN